MDVLILVIIKCCATKFLVTRTLYKFQNCPFNALSYIFVPGSHERTILNVMFSNINTQSHFFRTLPSLVHPPVRCFSCPYTTITNRKEQQSFASRYVCILPTVLRCYSYFTRFGGGWWSTRLPTAPCGRLVHCSPWSNKGARAARCLLGSTYALTTGRIVIRCIVETKNSLPHSPDISLERFFDWMKKSGSIVHTSQKWGFSSINTRNAHLRKLISLVLKAQKEEELCTNWIPTSDSTASHTVIPSAFCKIYMTVLTYYLYWRSSHSIPKDLPNVLERRSGNTL